MLHISKNNGEYGGSGNMNSSLVSNEYESQAFYGSCSDTISSSCSCSTVCSMCCNIIEPHQHHKILHNYKIKKITRLIIENIKNVNEKEKYISGWRNTIFFCERRCC